MGVQLTSYDKKMGALQLYENNIYLHAGLVGNGSPGYFQWDNSSEILWSIHVRIISTPIVDFNRNITFWHLHLKSSEAVINEGEIISVPSQVLCP